MRIRILPSVFVWVIAACLAIADPAPADDYARTGFYLGASVLGGAYTQLDDELEDDLRDVGVFVSSDTDMAVGFEVYGGYRLHPHFALEGEFEMFPEADIELSGAGTVAELESWTATANAKAFPWTGRAQPFVLLGVGAMNAEIEDTLGLGVRESETAFAARFGGGVDFYATANVVVSVGVDYLLPTGDLDALDYVSFGGGLQFRF